MNTWKSNLEATKQRYIDWWNHKGVILNMWEHLQEGVSPHADVPHPGLPCCLDQKWFDPKWRARYLDWYVAHSSLKADILPVANTQLGPGSLAAILGSRLEGGDDTIWIHPDPDFDDSIRFDRKNPAWQLHLDLLKACKQQAKGHYYVGMPDLMEGLDVLAALKGTDKVLLDLMTQPKVVERQLQDINDVYFEVFDELYDIIREGDEMAFCYFSSWAPGKMTKLQSDISTMISEDDYRRFVQPYLREQCRRIPYTLYHLDGVGAVRHLPALLEIEELKAIQWTPGVGQPQGGDPKWYDLYRRILSGGKSVMACWVTLDQLRPLLDAIGTEGVHLEMDFKNEREIEQAIKIMEDYTSCPKASCSEAPIVCSQSRESLAEAMDRRILVLDGATGTSIQAYGLNEKDFRGLQYADNKIDLKGCNDLLCLTQPQVPMDVHRRFIQAGADIITTNTFNAQRVSLAGFGMEGKVREINVAAAVIARNAANLYAAPGKPVYVFGGIGPTAKCITLNGISARDLKFAYLEQAQALMEGGVDALLIETIFDAENARTALDACCEAMEKAHRQVPVFMSYTLKDPKGFNMLGQDLLEVMRALPQDKVCGVGLNCSLGAESLMPFLRRLAAELPFRIIAFPNAGLPNKDGVYDQTPEIMQQKVWPLVEDHIVNIIGGCCGTNHEHIRRIAALVSVDETIYLRPHRPGVAPAEAPKAEAPKPEAPKVEVPKAETPKTEAPKAEAPKAEAQPAAADSQDAGKALFTSILKGKLPEAEASTRQLIEASVTPQDIINQYMIAAMSAIGQDFQEGKAFVPQLLMAARAMKGAMALLKPLMEGAKVETLGKAVIGTVKGDLHDIGKNLVASMLEGCGFEVINIGIDIPKEKFIDSVKENQADILVMSALLTTTMGYMKEVIEAFKEAGLRDQVKIMVGGAPVSEEFAKEIGADGYSDNANSAVALAKRLMGVA